MPAATLQCQDDGQTHHPHRPGSAPRAASPGTARCPRPGERRAQDKDTP